MATASFTSAPSSVNDDSAHFVPASGPKYTGLTFTVDVQMDSEAAINNGMRFHFSLCDDECINYTNNGLISGSYETTSVTQFTINIGPLYVYGNGADGTLAFESYDPGSNNTVASCTTIIHVNDQSNKLNINGTATSLNEYSYHGGITEGSSYSDTFALINTDSVQSASWNSADGNAHTISPLSSCTIEVTAPYTSGSSTYFAESVTITPVSTYGTTKTISFHQYVNERQPTITISAQSSTQENSSFNITVNATDVDGTVTSIDVSFNGATQTISSSSGTVSFTAPSVTGNTAYSISVTAHSSDGGSSTKSQTITVTEKPPTVSISSSSSVQENSTFNVTASASDDGGIDHINVTCNGTTHTISSSSGTVSFTAPSTSGSNSSTTVTATAYASDGGTANTSKTITVTEKVPTVSITSIPSSVTEGNTFNVSVSASDDSGIDHTVVSISGSSSTINASSGTVTLTAPSVSGTNTSFTVTATTYSVDGGTASTTASITVNEITPTVSITSIPSSVGERANFNVSVSASDDSGIDHVDVSISGSSKTITGGSGTVTLTAPSTTGSNATFSVTATAYPSDGGTSASTSHNITVVESGTSVSVNSYPSSVGEGATFSVRASGSDDSGINHIGYTFNSTTKTASSGTSVSFTAPHTSGSNQSYTMSITAYANDGNTASTSRSITVIESGASIVSCTYKDKARSGGKLDITVNGSDDSEISTVSINYHGTVYTGSNNTPITIKCDRTNKKITDTFTAIVTANDGNTASSTYSFTLLPGMSFDKLFVARYVGMDVTRILFGGGPMTILGKQLIGGGRII